MENEIRQLYLQGYPKKKICRELGCTFYKVNMALMDIPGAVPLPEDETCLSILQDWNNGERKLPLSKKYKCDVSIIHKVLLHHGADMSRKRTIQMNTKKLSSIETEEDAYWLGFIMADGYVSQVHNHLDISLKDVDAHHLQLLADYFESDAKVTYRNVGKHRACRVTFCSKELVASLVSHGCIQNKSLVLEFPTIKQELVHHFLRGYFDGDGSVSYNHEAKKSFDFHFIGTESFVTEARRHIGLSDTKLYKKGEAYDLRYGGVGNAKKLYDYLYQDANVYLARKHDVFLRAVLSMPSSGETR